MFPPVREINWELWKGTNNARTSLYCCPFPLLYVDCRNQTPEGFGGGGNKGGNCVGVLGGGSIEGAGGEKKLGPSLWAGRRKQDPWHDKQSQFPWHIKTKQGSEGGVGVSAYTRWQVVECSVLSLVLLRTVCSTRVSPRVLLKNQLVRRDRWICTMQRGEKVFILKFKLEEPS